MAGARTVTVTDANNCTTTNSVNITQPGSGMTTSTAAVNVLCFGNSTGAATVTATGGSGAYTYAWSTGATTSVITTLNAGVRTVTVSDASSCTSTNTVTITQPASALTTATAITNVACFGNSTGAATVTASGGTSPYTYFWSGAQTASVISGQVAGVNTVTVTDANSCTMVATANITQPASALATSTAVTNVLCFGNSTGAATVTASGGTSPYTYAWSGAQTTSVISGQLAGVKSVTVTDANNCSTTNSVNITQPGSGMTTSTAAVNVLCFGNSTGSATVTATGGSGAYTYAWSSGAATSVITTLNAGVRTVTVSDASSCTSTNTVTITQPASALTTATAITNVACFGNSTGAATVTASGGTSPYSYVWSGAQTTSVISGQLAGVKTVTLTDANSCTMVATANINQPASALATSTAVTNVLCFGNSTGAATVTASGGTSPYTYTWSSAATTSVSTTLNAGVTTVTVIDANSCASINTITITQPPALSVSISASAFSLCAGNSVTLSSTSTGGNGSITYTWNSGSNNTVQIVSPLVTTTYTLNATDANNCSNTSTLSLTVSATPTISVNSGSVCSGQIFTINPSGANSYTYSSGSSTITATTNTIITIIGTSSLGCVSANTVSSNISVVASPTIVVNSGSICSGDSFVINASGASTYTYSSGNATVTPTVNTSYTVTGTSSAGCLNSNLAISSVSVNVTPTITVNSGSICSGESFVILASGASTYTYSSGSATVSPISNDSYSITGTSSEGCISSNTAICSVFVNSLPTVSVNNGTICSGGSFTITPSGTNTYTIQGGNSVVSPNTNGNYTVVGESSEGCLSSNTATCNLIVNQLPIINATSTNSNTICVGESATLSVNGVDSYTWNPGGTGTSIVISPTSTTTYSILAIDNNGCENSSTLIQSVDNCTGIDEATKISNQKFISIYPNPTNGITNVILNEKLKGETVDVLKIQIVTIHGQIIKVETVKSEQLSIDLSRYPAGIYFVQVLNEGNITYTQKIIKQN